MKKEKIKKNQFYNKKNLVIHEYDGIKEFDNKMPKWLLWLFYITIIFSAIYLIRYHVIKTGDSQEKEYVKEMEKAAVLKKSNDSYELTPMTLTVLADNKNLTEGKAIYNNHCLACHLAKGEGLVGPNLTDVYWIYGGSISDIYKFIENGNPSKGMIAWKDKLTPLEIQQVASFILSLQGTNPPNPKAPEGELHNTK